MIYVLASACFLTEASAYSIVIQVVIFRGLVAHKGFVTSPDHLTDNLGLAGDHEGFVFEDGHILISFEIISGIYCSATSSKAVSSQFAMIAWLRALKAVRSLIPSRLVSHPILRPK